MHRSPKVPITFNEDVICSLKCFLREKNIATVLVQGTTSSLCACGLLELYRQILYILYYVYMLLVGLIQWYKLTSALLFIANEFMTSTLAVSHIKALFRMCPICVTYANWTLDKSNCVHICNNC